MKWIKIYKLYFLISDGSWCKIPHTIYKTQLGKFVVGEEKISKLQKNEINN